MFAALPAAAIEPPQRKGDEADGVRAGANRKPVGLTAGEKQQRRQERLPERKPFDESRRQPAKLARRVRLPSTRRPPRRRVPSPRARYRPTRTSQAGCRTSFVTTFPMIDPSFAAYTGTAARGRDVLPGGAAHALPQNGRVDERAQGADERLAIARRHEKAGPAVLDDFGNRIDVAADGRDAAGGGLLVHDAERLVPRRHHEQIRAPPQLEPPTGVRRDAADDRARRAEPCPRRSGQSVTTSRSARSAKPPSRHASSRSGPPFLGKSPPMKSTRGR